MDNKQKKSDEQTSQKTPKRIIRLDDLDFGGDVVGGASEKLLFGESPTPSNPFEKGIGAPRLKGSGD